MPKRTSHFSKKARSGQDKNMNENPFRKSSKNSRKRKAGIDSLPESKRKQTEKEVEVSYNK